MTDTRIDHYDMHDNNHDYEYAMSGLARGSYCDAQYGDFLSKVLEQFLDKIKKLFQSGNATPQLESLAEKATTALQNPADLGTMQKVVNVISEAFGLDPLSQMRSRIEKAEKAHIELDSKIKQEQDAVHELHLALSAYGDTEGEEGYYNLTCQIREIEEIWKEIDALTIDIDLAYKQAIAQSVIAVDKHDLERLDNIARNLQCVERNIVLIKAGSSGTLESAKDTVDEAIKIERLKFYGIDNE